MDATASEDALLDARSHNYLAALAEAQGELALAWLDVSTADFAAQPIVAAQLAASLARLAPGELLVPDRLLAREPLKAALEDWNPVLTPLPSARFDSDNARKRLQALFNVAALDSFGSFSRAEVAASPLYAQTVQGVKKRWGKPPNPEAHYAYLKARDRLMTHVLKTMADHGLDAIVHKAVEHQPTRIAEGIAPPYVDQKGASHLNTFVLWVPSIVVPAGFTSDALPAGITFLGRPYDDARMLHLAYAYEQATHHRKAPASVPPEMLHHQTSPSQPGWRGPLLRSRSNWSVPQRCTSSLSGEPVVPSARTRARPGKGVRST